MPIETTYFGALSSGEVEPGPNDEVYGVVNHINDSLLELIDVNLMWLSPPKRIFVKYKEMESEMGREKAWEESNFPLIYEDYLYTTGYAREQAKRVKAKSKVRVVWLVCYEKDDTYCHRRLLKEYIENQVKL